MLVFISTFLNQFDRFFVSLFLHLISVDFAWCLETMELSALTVPRTGRS